MTTMIAEIYDALREAGASEEMARKAAEAVAIQRETLVTKAELATLATKADLEALRGDMRADLEALRGDTRADLEALRGDTRAAMAALRGELVLVKWMLGVLLAGVVSLVLKAFFAS